METARVKTSSSIKRKCAQGAINVGIYIIHAALSLFLPALCSVNDLPVVQMLSHQGQNVPKSEAKMRVQLPYILKCKLLKSNSVQQVS
jgi:hypothetical protein